MSPYLRKLVALHAAGAVKRGQVHRLDVLHDEWCPKLRGGHCACDPDLKLDGRKVEVAES